MLAQMRFVNEQRGLGGEGGGGGSAQPAKLGQRLQRVLSFAAFDLTMM